MSAARHTCANCGRPIRRDDEGWYHAETALARCPVEMFAIPAEEAAQ